MTARLPHARRPLFPQRKVVRAHESGAIYTAEEGGRYYLLIDEKGLLGYLDVETDAWLLERLVEVYAYPDEKDRDWALTCLELGLRLRDSNRVYRLGEMMLETLARQREHGEGLPEFVCEKLAWLAYQVQSWRWTGWPMLPGGLVQLVADFGRALGYLPRDGYLVQLPGSPWPNGRVSVVWQSGPRRLAAAIEVGEMCGPRPLRKLLATPAEHRFWLYYGANDPQPVIAAHDPQGQVRLVHIPLVGRR